MSDHQMTLDLNQDPMGDWEGMVVCSCGIAVALLTSTETAGREQARRIRKAHRRAVAP